MTTSCCNPIADRRRCPRGMTLVELLVVTGLMAVLLGLLVVGLRGWKGVEPLPSVLAAAHGRALGVPEGAAVILATGMGPEPNAAVACTKLFEATMLPLIEAMVTGTDDPANPTAWPRKAIPPSGIIASSTITLTSATVAVQPANGEELARAYKLMLSGTELGPPKLVLGPSSPWFQWTLLASSTVSGVVTGTGALDLRGALGQTTNNTVWPKPSAAGAFNAVLAQYPAKSSAAFEMQQGMAIDLRFSGIGDDRTTAYGRLDLMTTSTTGIAIVFDRVGRVAEVIQQVPDPGWPATPGAAQPAIPVGTIYFLVVPRDQIVAAVNSNTLASVDAKWVALVPQTGRIFVADNVVQTGTDTADLRAARANVRQGIAVGK